jgi:peroxiredoxin
MSRILLSIAPSGLSRAVPAKRARAARVICSIWLACIVTFAAELPNDVHPSLSLWVQDLAGHVKDALAANRAKAILFVFLSVDCPICNSYAPNLRRIASEFGKQGVVVRLVFPDPDESRERIQQHLKEFNLPFETYLDHDQVLTRAVGAQVTPEAAVFVPGRGWVYHGRIDDRFMGFGKARPQPTSEEVKDVLTAVVAGKPVTVKSARPVGCSIAPLP